MGLTSTTDEAKTENASGKTRVAVVDFRSLPNAAGRRTRSWQLRVWGADIGGGARIKTRRDGSNPLTAASIRIAKHGEPPAYLLEVARRCDRRYTSAEIASAIERELRDLAEYDPSVNVEQLLTVEDGVPRLAEYVPVVAAEDSSVQAAA